MSILNLLQVYTFCTDPQLLPFIIIRWVQLTLRYGLTDMACLAFASWGVILCAVDQSEEGYRYAQLSLKLFHRCKFVSAQVFARLQFLVYGMLAPFKMALRSTFGELQKAIPAAIDSGDFECTQFTAYTHILHSLSSGDRLPNVDAMITRYLPLMTRSQGPWLALTLLVRDYMDSYRNEKDNQLVLSHEIVPGTNKQQFMLLECANACYTCQLAYHFGDFDSALVSARASRMAENVMKTTFIIVFQYFFDAMTLLEKAHTSKRLRRMRQASRIIRKVSKLAKQCPDNTLHKLHLLKGEQQVLKGNLGAALDWYKMAMAHASKADVPCMNGLANERSAIALIRLGGGPDHAKKVNDHLRRAVELYEYWGADALAKRIKKKYGFDEISSTGPFPGAK